MDKNRTDRAKMNRAHDGSELVLEVGPLAIFRSSSVEYGEKHGDMPNIRPCYTVAVNPNWLDDGGQVELCIAGNVRIVGTDAPLAANDSLVQIINVDGQHIVMVLNEDREHEDRLQLEPMPENNAKAN